MSVAISDIDRIKHIAINLQLELSRLPGLLEPKHITDLRNITARLSRISEQYRQEAEALEADEKINLTEVQIMLKEIAG